MLVKPQMLPMERPGEGAAPGTDRRASSRICTVYFVAKVIRESDAGLFRVRNISDAGLMLATHVAFAQGERVTVELLSDLSVSGHVAWCEDGCCGVEFDQPIDCPAVLHARMQQKLDRRGTALRLSVCRLATCYSEKGIRAVTVKDVSRRGVGLAHDGFLEPGMSLKLVIESGTARTGTVCWSHDNQAGVRLSEPLTCEELESARHL